MMDKEAREWAEDAIALCKRANETKVSILLRNDDAGIVVTSEITYDEIRELGRALACGYGTNSEGEEIV